MARKRALGKGLEALIPAGPKLRPGALELPIDQIRPNPRQPRSEFSEPALEQLADSIRQHGVLQPLLVTTAGDEYQLVAGERRLQAARLAGLEVVPVIVREAGERSSLELALVENLQRTDLNPLEAAEGYRQLVDDFGLSHDEVGARVGKSRSHVSNTLRLLKLSATVRKALAAGEISEGHARALLAISRAEDQANLMRTIISKGLNVRQSEALVRQLGAGKPRRSKASRQNPEESDLQARLETALGTKVRIRSGRSGGQVVISYYSVEELNAIADQLLAAD
jgi:ParB family chromosome partitioning protein